LPTSRRALSTIANYLTLGWSERPRPRLFLRRTVFGAIRAALWSRSKRLPTVGSSSVLVVAPHPDDETLGCGGTVALLARNGASPFIAFLTDGGASHPSHASVSYADISRIRRNEALEATARLGLHGDQIAFLDARDGTLGHMGAERRSEILWQILHLLEKIRPKIILLPCRGDGSSEHDAAFPLVREAVGRSGQRPRLLEYPIWSLWNSTLLLNPLVTCRRVWRVDFGAMLATKKKAMASYRSQIQPIPPDSLPALQPEFVAMLMNGPEFLFEH
jgi:N-acetylglucosamine malate deacetylase 1